MHGTRKKFRRKIFYDNITIEIARTNNIPVTKVKGVYGNTPRNDCHQI